VSSFSLDHLKNSMRLSYLSEKKEFEEVFGGTEL